MFRFILIAVMAIALTSPTPSFAHHQGIKYGTFKTEAGKFLFYKPKAKKAEVVKFGDCKHLHELSSRLEKEAAELQSILPSKTSKNELKRIESVAKFIHNNQHRKSQKAIAEKLSGLNNSLKAAQKAYLSSTFYDSASEDSKVVISRFEKASQILNHLLNDAGVSVSSN